MNCEQVYMGKSSPSWGQHKKIKYITFSVTDECNLRCTYCYFTHKTDKNVMSFSVAKAAVDDILNNTDNLRFDGVVWDFIGGEPTLEMKLIDQISDYILFQMYQKKHKWLSCYHFMIGTNGLLYKSVSVQNYIKKHGSNLYIAITIDGSKEKHDLSRIKKDGSGSYDDVASVIPLWKRQFLTHTTKATFAHDDLPYLKDSIVHLWSMGINNVSANVVFEDVWQDGDAEIFKNQLYQLANFIIENDLWYDYSVRFFDPNVGNPVSDHQMRINFCGTGTMLAINSNGDYYPCVRFMPSAMNHHSFQKIGDIKTGVDSNRLRAFSTLSTYNQSEKKCLECDISGGCTWCSGLNYDCSSIGTLFERKTYLCDLHKANVEVNKYLWRQYELKKGKISPYRYQKLTTHSKGNKYLYIYGSNDFPCYCGCSVQMNDSAAMGKETLQKAIEFCELNNYVPIFCGFDSLPNDYYGYEIIEYKDLKSGRKQIHSNYLPQLVINEKDVDETFNRYNSINDIIITSSGNQLDVLLEKISMISQMRVHANINIFIDKARKIDSEFIEAYSDFLRGLKELILTKWRQRNYININLLTNELFANSNRYCGAGNSSLTLAPTGRFYICPAFYKDEPDRFIGTLTSGIENLYKKYCDMDNAPLCSTCDVRHCTRCVFQNKKLTGEISVPSEGQCVLAHLEYLYSSKLIEELQAHNVELPFDINSDLKKINAFDPLEKLRGTDYMNCNYSKKLKALLEEKSDER